MCDLDVWREQDLPAACPNGRAEVDVFEIHHVTLIQQTHSLRVRAANEKTRAADPVREVLVPRQRIDVTLGDAFLPQLRDRTDHLSKRQFGAAVCVDESRSDDGDVRTTVE